MNTPTPIIITLDGNIGAGKSTLLEAIRVNLPNITVIQEPVGIWLTMKNAEGESLLSLFYKDTSRWAYTFQNCALLTRLIDAQNILKAHATGEIKTPVIITERSILTDRYVFAEMLHKQGKIDEMEWGLYMRWFDHFVSSVPYSGIIHLTTSAETSKGRIVTRHRNGEESIPLTYLQDLDAAHNDWIATSTLPVLQISTESGADVGDLTRTIEKWISATF